MYIHTYIYTYIHTLLHSFPLGALLPHMKIKTSSYKEKRKKKKEKKLFTDKNINYKNSLHFDDKKYHLMIYELKYL